MATIHHEFLIDATPEVVWDAVRDVGEVHRRLAPGFALDCRMEEGKRSRTVQFASGLVAHELIVTIDDERRRVAYASVGGRAAHHNASMQVFAETDGRSRLVWITDLLPDTLEPAIRHMVEQGSEVIRRTLEASAQA